MTVLENLQMGAFLTGEGTKEDYDRVYELFPLLHERRLPARRDTVGRRAADGGDGPGAHVPAEAAADGRAVDGPRARSSSSGASRSSSRCTRPGVAVLVVEQNANVSLSIADRGYVLSTGRLVLEGKAGDLLQDENLRKAYLGR